MADRTSARVFSKVFTILDQAMQTYPACSEAIADIVAHVWVATWECDFHPCQMECNEVLQRLGLAHYRPVGDDGEWFHKDYS